MLNLIRANLKVAPDERVGKPDELKKYEQMKALGLPVWAGGLQDQPHIWLEMIGVIENTISLFEAMSRTSQAQREEGRNATG